MRKVTNLLFLVNNRQSDPHLSLTSFDNWIINNKRDYMSMSERDREREKERVRGRMCKLWVISLLLFLCYSLSLSLSLLQYCLLIGKMRTMLFCYSLKFELDHNSLRKLCSQLFYWESQIQFLSIIIVQMFPLILDQFISHYMTLHCYLLFPYALCNSLTYNKYIWQY